MASIIARLTARSGQEQALERILRELVSATAREPGAISYDLLRVEGSPGSFVVSERYRDDEARRTHLASPHLARAMAAARDLLSAPPENQLAEPIASIRREFRAAAGRQVLVTCLPIGPVNLVYAQTDRGLIGCGAIDPQALERFQIAAARVTPAGTSVASFEDLLAGRIREANAPARELGITPGQSAHDALACL